MEAIKSFFLNTLEKRPLNIGVIGAIVSHSIIATICFSTLYILDFFHELPNAVNLQRWDAVWYNYVRQFGYTYMNGTQNSTAFFPLFPAVWEALNVNAVWISLVNVLVFYVGYYLLATNLNFTFRIAFFWLSTPLFFFCYVPYSESFFFLGGALLLIGFEKQNDRMLFVGTVLASATRSVGMLFIPAFLFTYLIFHSKYTFANFNRYLQAILCVIIVNLTVFLTQYIQTGEWFVFFETQKAWRRELQLPTLPFASMADDKIRWLDVIGLFAAIVSISYAASAVWKRLFTSKPPLPARPGLLFSIAYGCSVGLVSIFYTGVWHEDSGSLLMSLPRFVFVSPFFVYAVGYFGRVDFSKQKYAPIMSVILLAWLAYSPSLPYPIFYLILIASYICAYFFIHRPVISYSLALINTFLQVILFDMFLNRHWIA